MKKIMIILLTILLLSLTGCSFFTINKAHKLDIPNNIIINDRIIKWDEVKHTNSYRILINNEEIRLNKTQYNLGIPFGIVRIQIRAVSLSSKNNSDWSEVYYYYDSDIIKLTADGFLYEIVDVNDNYYTKYKNDFKEVIIHGYISDNNVVSIPDYIEGIIVTTIAPFAFIRNKYLEEVIIPNKVEYIGKNVFEKCENLTNIILPNSLENILYDTFRYCTSLESIIIPLNIKIVETAFYGCENLTIYCRVKQKPEQWSITWNLIALNKFANTIWGHEG